jgi:CelD/BcsL family acetyltransferase involved in cellulose biosynthesis
LEAEIRTDAAAIAEVLAISVESWAHREGTGIGSTPANEGFYRSLTSAAEARGWLRIALLRGPDGEAVAYELNLVRGGEAVNLKLGYRESAAVLSPGLVLRDRVMDALIAENAATFDLLGTAEPYKLHWAGRTVPHLRLRGFPPTAAGRLAHGYRHRLRPAAGRVLRWVGWGRRETG